jgi:hypothetical protein
MKRITFHLPVWASYAIDVEVSDEAFANDDFDEAMDDAYDKLPTGLCYGCSTGNTGGGWGSHPEVTLELGDAPEVQYAVDEDGNVVYGDIDAKMGW